MIPRDPVADPAAVEARCLARRLDVEGVPMVLALEDLSTADQQEAAGARELGARLADLLEHYRAALRPTAPDEDEDAVHDVVVVLAAAHAPAPDDPAAR